MVQTVELLEAVRDTRIFIPVVLGVHCGLRRGEIIALRWRQVDLANAQLAVVESAEQTGDGAKIKPPSSTHAKTASPCSRAVSQMRGTKSLPEPRFPR